MINLAPSYQLNLSGVQSLTKFILTRQDKFQLSILVTHLSRTMNHVQWNTPEKGSVENASLEKKLSLVFLANCDKSLRLQNRELFFFPALQKRL